MLLPLLKSHSSHSSLLLVIPQAKMMRRRRFICCFWQWRLIVSQKTMLMTHGCHLFYRLLSDIVWHSLSRGFWQWQGIRREKELAAETAASFKADFETLTAHIYSIQQKSEKKQNVSLTLSSLTLALTFF